MYNYYFPPLDTRRLLLHAEVFKGLSKWTNRNPLRGRRGRSNSAGSRSNVYVRMHSTTPLPTHPATNRTSGAATNKHLWLESRSLIGPFGGRPAAGSTNYLPGQERLNFLTAGAKMAKFDRGAGAGRDGWSVLATHLMGRDKYIMGCVETSCFNLN